jgi:hypothetical protein
VATHAQAIGRQRTVLGRLAREVERKREASQLPHHTPIGAAVQQALFTTLERAKRIWAQTAAKKNREGKGKLYAFHAPEVECIGKGTSRQPYEFGVKVGIATTLKGNRMCSWTWATGVWMRTTRRWPSNTGAPEFDTNRAKLLICIGRPSGLPLQQAQLGVV